MKQLIKDIIDCVVDAFLLVSLTAAVWYFVLPAIHVRYISKDYGSINGIHYCDTIEWCGAEGRIIRNQSTIINQDNIIEIYREEEKTVLGLY